jgi:hypothetical protein
MIRKRQSNYEAFVVRKARQIAKVNRTTVEDVLNDDFYIKEIECMYSWHLFQNKREDKNCGYSKVK